jgi:hypothetical protein
MPFSPEDIRTDRSAGLALANPEAMNWLTFNPCGLRINLRTGEVVIPEGLSLDEASRAFWEGLGRVVR